MDEFMIVRSPSPYNGIIGRPGVRRIQAVSSTAHGMLKFLVTGGTITLRSSRIIPLEYEGRKELCGLLRRNLDIFSWKPADMTGVPRHIAEHSLNICKGCLPVRQKKRGQAPERNKTIYEEVKKLVDAEAVLSLPSLKCLKDVQRLNGKLASLNRFLSKSAEKSLPFSKTLKKCTKKSNFQWTAKAETAFKQMKTLIAELPMLTTLKEKEELVIYLAAAKEAVSAVLMTERDGKQMPIYFVSRALQDQPIKQMLSSPEVAGRLLKWRFELEEHEIHYRPRTSVKGRILADFIVKRLEDDIPDTPIKDKEELSDLWILFDSQPPDSGTNGGENLQVNVDSKLVANQVNGTYVAKDPGMIKYLEKVLVEELKEKSIDEKEVLAIVEEEGHTCMTPIYKYLTKEILLKEKRKARAIRRKAGEIISDNGKQFKDNLFKDCNEETPFSLTYGTEAVIQVEIGMPTLITAKVDMIKNDDALEINLDLLQEKREHAAIQEAKSKAMMKKIL
nr:hypothetical protein [Tanacetum cinerariifolium]